MLLACCNIAKAAFTVKLNHSIALFHLSHFSTQTASMGITQAEAVRKVFIHHMLELFGVWMYKWLLCIILLFNGGTCINLARAIVGTVTVT